MTIGSFGEVGAAGEARTARVQVFLNDAHGSFSGFDEVNARLRPAAVFDIAAPSDSAALFVALEDIFTQLNVGGDVFAATEYTTKYHAAGNRSLSVGDVVVVGESAYSVARCGFAALSGAAVGAALDAVGVR